MYSKKDISNISTVVRHSVKYVCTYVGKVLSKASYWQYIFSQFAL